MPDDRRSFIKRFGVTLGSLIVSGSLPGCGPKKEAGLSGTESKVNGQDELSPAPCGPEWEQLRQCWLGLKTLNEDMDEAFRQHASRFMKGPMTAEVRIALREASEKSDAVPRKRVASHQALLDTLVAEGQVAESVAKHMQVAFEEATYHLVRSRATCYLGLPLEHAPRQDLLQQANMLRKISSDLDSTTAAKAQAAIAQDVAFFEIFKPGDYDYRALEDNYKAGSLKASPEALEGARLLTQLFLGRPE